MILLPPNSDCIRAVIEFNVKSLGPDKTADVSRVFLWFLTSTRMSAYCYYYYYYYYYYYCSKLLNMALLAYANSKATGLMTAYTQACAPGWPSTLTHQEETGRGRVRLRARYRQRLARDGRGTIRPARLRRRGMSR
jgi:hypothetical protein